MKLLWKELCIRDAQKEDAVQLAAWWNDGSVMAHAGFPKGLGTTSEQVWQDIVKDSDDTRRRLILSFSGKRIGEMSFRVCGVKTAEIGIKICEADYQDRGLGRVYLSMLIRELFDRGFQKICLDTNLKNTRAQHVYELLGFRRLRINENSWTDQLGNLQSSVDYELCPEDFRDKRNAAFCRQMDILGENRFETFTRTRAGSRAVILQEGRILLSHELNSGWWLVPGGGMEEGETPVTCCIREVEEETGYIVRPVRKFLVLNEYYEEYRYISHYFVCEVTGKGRMNLTDAEKKRGLVPEWLPLQEALDIFSRHQDYAEESEEKRGSYLREYTALKAWAESPGEYDE